MGGNEKKDTPTDKPSKPQPNVAEPVQPIRASEQSETPLMVFLSSHVNLREERNIVEAAVHFIPATRHWLFEYTPTSSKKTEEPNLSQVRECDIFIILLGTQYSKAVELQYQTAVESKKPILAFVQQGEKKPEQHNFINSLGVKYSSYTRLSDLPQLVLASVLDELVRRSKGTLKPAPNPNGLQSTRDKLAEDLACLPPQKIVAFGASCSERMVNYYDEFTKEAGWGDFVFIRSMLDLIWEFLLGEQGTKEKLQAAILKLDENLDELVPDDIFALATCVCIGRTIDLCLGVKQSVAVIVDYAFEPISQGRCLAITGDIYQFGSGPEEIEFDKAIVRDSFVKKEIDLQREDLALLKSQKDLSQDIILLLKNKAKENQWRAKNILSTPKEFEIPLVTSI
jgi:uncharacterized protein YjaG (DUF416 family)